jgi:hypothetical protein
VGSKQARKASHRERVFSSFGLALKVTLDKRAEYSELESLDPAAFLGATGHVFSLPRRGRSRQAFTFKHKNGIIDFV